MMATPTLCCWFDCTMRVPAISRSSARPSGIVSVCGALHAVSLALLMMLVMLVVAGMSVTVALLEF